jgi:hypothetical protein
MRCVTGCRERAPAGRRECGFFINPHFLVPVSNRAASLTIGAFLPSRPPSKRGPDAKRIVHRCPHTSAISRHAFCCSLVRYCSGFLLPRGSIFDSIFVPATKGPAQTLMYPISPDHKLTSIASEMYSFASGTIVSAGTSSPSRPGTQPVSLNISLASFRRAIHFLGIALLMVRRSRQLRSQVRGLVLGAHRELPG